MFIEATKQLADEVVTKHKKGKQLRMWLLEGTVPVFPDPSPIDDTTATRSEQKKYDLKLKKAMDDREQWEDESLEVLMTILQ